ncbi:uncharacterized protein LOC108112364 [Drosophila eugracilis]|uniref:uncharacterized protein LOC108112364 n=1 Tax=Drosophila eugracilis TaxID=29029 RepID=UPI0007E5F3D5|nr:uncharacterized protein LOC108112364 [Drosophila eugracilis]
MFSKSQLLLLVVGFCLNAAVSGDVDCSKRPPFVDPKTCCPIPEFVMITLKDSCGMLGVTPPPCFYFCFLNMTNIYKNQKLSQNGLNGYMQLVTKSDLHTTYTQAFTTCATKVAEFEANLPALTASSPPPICPEDYLMGCVFRNFMKNCPDSVRNDSQECKDMKEFSTKCEPPLGPSAEEM